jgi:hypothetical protein
MNEATVLLMLRLASGALLLGFLGGLAWLVYQDLARTAAALAQEEEVRGNLRVVASSERGPALETLFPLLAETRIGRAPGNNIVLDDGFVSAEHALLSRREGRWWLEDLGSRNGTLLNDLPLEETAVVGVGDVITIGDVALRIEGE